MLEENHLERFLVRGSERDHFDCRNFKGGRCSIYDARPETCRTYPLNTIQNEQPSNTCRHCGYDATHTEKS
jgi:Fe-S-cluster containining protein